MQKKNYSPAFLIFFILALLLYIFSQLGLLKNVTGFFENGTVSMQRLIFNTFADSDASSDLEKIKEANNTLTAQLAKMREIERENQALRDQFAASKIASEELLPAEVIGITGNRIVIDKGIDDNVKAGDVVVVKESLIGQVIKTSQRISVVNSITGENISFTAATLKNQTQGIVRGQGNSLIFDNVTLSDKLENGEIVITKGNVDEAGSGFPPDLVVGKIQSVNKKASNLFQTAEVKSLVDFGKLEMVFVMITQN